MIKTINVTAKDIEECTLDPILRAVRRHVKENVSLVMLEGSGVKGIGILTGAEQVLLLDWYCVNLEWENWVLQPTTFKLDIPEKYLC